VVGVTGAGGGTRSRKGGGMSVQVVLMAEVKDLGAEGDIVNVADGYARNCLFPRKLAALVTPATLKRLEKIRRERDVEQKAAQTAARELSNRVSQCSVTIAVKVSEGEKLFGSVSVAEIVRALQSQGVEIREEQVVMEKPIKELGVYEIPIRLHPEVTASLKLWVVEE
jgi:large subunit ribosomal protein L9